ncbi:tRNA pseudouridine synthase A [Dictyocaulus viviparus]|uniref:Pseudouridylate synthase 1 homolog n=1 Tax=Dictyocaulus viviparus TaxID=29172 RepID=A0A0D8Y7B6_DICVI|nr:tRNA pseudouridine synthase A [Dictyocaulus viviparus]
MFRRLFEKLVTTMTKVAEVIENKSDAALHKVQSGRVESHNAENVKIRIKKARYAVLLAYQGKEYFGMQIQKQHPTIEGFLIDSMNKLGWITDDMRDQPALFHFQRAARTDRAVSAVRQICGMELPRSDEYALTGASQLNALLPEDIRVIAIRRTTNSFHPQKMCCARTYSYTLPTFAFAKPTELTNSAFRISKETLDELQSLLSIYEGTHNFFNYTSKREFDDRSCYRYILSFKCGEPFLFHDDVRDEDVEFIQLTVKGQSFVLHQIRKMVGMVITVMRELQYKSYIQRTFEGERVDVPRAPGLGLLLERVHYDVYDRKCAFFIQNLQCPHKCYFFWHAKTHEPLTDWGSEAEARIADLKFNLITKDMLLSELRLMPMLQWLADLPRHNFCTDPESDPVAEVPFVTMAYSNINEGACDEERFIDEVDQEETSTNNEGANITDNNEIGEADATETYHIYQSFFWHAKTHEPLTDWGSEAEARIADLKFNLITKDMLLSELRLMPMLQWLADLPRHNFCTDPESDPVAEVPFITMAYSNINEVLHYNITAKYRAVINT